MWKFFPSSRWDSLRSTVTLPRPPPITRIHANQTQLSLTVRKSRPLESDAIPLLRFSQRRAHNRPLSYCPCLPPDAPGTRTGHPHLDTQTRLYQPQRLCGLSAHCIIKPRPRLPPWPEHSLLHIDDVQPAQSSPRPTKRGYWPCVLLRSCRVASPLFLRHPRLAVWSFDRFQTAESLHLAGLGQYQNL